MVGGGRRVAEFGVLGTHGLRSLTLPAARMSPGERGAALGCCCFCGADACGCMSPERGGAAGVEAEGLGIRSSGR